MSENEKIHGTFEKGIGLLKVCRNRRPERVTFCLKLETHQILLFKKVDGCSILENAIDLREVKEVRIGKNSKAFEVWPEETRKFRNEECFVILYGNSFILNSLSGIAKEEECEMLVKDIRQLAAESANAPHSILVGRWLRKEFYRMEKSRGVITIKDLEMFLTKINVKMTTNRLQELLQDVDGEIGYEDFASFYHKLIRDEQDNIITRMTEIDSEIFASFYHDSIHADQVFDGEHTKDKPRITLKWFRNFLIKQQKDHDATDEQKVSQLMREYFQDPARNIQEPFFTVSEFIDFLFSKQNDVWDEQHNEVNQDMTQPLVNYWIASSHKTYLNSGQLNSEVSVEAYARCLRMGCRCIELECWDGPDYMPFVSLLNRNGTKFMDAIRTIKEHAFVTSEYPVILSIVNHCNLVQQRIMAAALHEVFGDMLLIEPVKRDSAQMPSPDQLKKKIIIMHKKIPAEEDETIILEKNEGAYSDTSDAVKNGTLHLGHPTCKEWKSYLFVLKQDKLYFNEELEDTEDEGQKDNNMHSEKNILGDHVGKKWFHEMMSRDEAQELLYQHSNLGDGIFLVRQSGVFPDIVSLSFLSQGTVHHCCIRKKQESGQAKYFLIDNSYFDTICNLITYYQSNPLKTHESCIRLTEPVSQIKKHEEMEWFHSNMTRAQAEEVLRRESSRTYLVRPSEREENDFVLSFRAFNTIKHARIRQEGGLYTIGTKHFDSLVELVNYYEEHGLYVEVKLKPSGSEQVIHVPSNITVKALYDYSAQRIDELSFCKYALITNVSKEDGGWWKGDYGGKLQHWFPANYVEEIELEESSDESFIEIMPRDLQKGSIDLIDCSVDVSSKTFGDKKHVFRILSEGLVYYLEAASEEDMLDWIHKIRETAQSFYDSLKHRKQLKKPKVAKELSSLLIYFKSKQFNIQEIGNFTEMASCPETKMEKWVEPERCEFLVKYPFYMFDFRRLCSIGRFYNRMNFSRVYPKASRIDSSNYDPIKMWNAGIQMVALNYQTADRAMQLNHARFLQNGRCGYVLRPKCMFDDKFDPHDPVTLQNVEPFVITIQIITARHLMETSKELGILFIEVEIVGAEYDCRLFNTSTKEYRGLNLVWRESFRCNVYNPDLAIIRFVAQSEDEFGNSKILGQAAYPITCLKPGFRSISLKNEFNEELELSRLLVHIDIQKISKEEISNNSNSSSESLTNDKQKIGDKAVVVSPNGSSQSLTNDKQKIGDEAVVVCLNESSESLTNNKQKIGDKAVVVSPSGSSESLKNDKQKIGDEAVVIISNPSSES
ncbi:1-phosphatidylinositol 4,5-bisphosphate phosphodiesterase gamma-1-like [Argiope bruennichi]|uniref:1-phosphatidylinositol 4,5-bisphosphate phosphodiesterase gamma-1-like n=1 Tax=Argiope bruennichi TaxID=94029 RepID=UPI002494FCFB|nr:1-phosphatidylinositol 4,5-bisphosphate phosphodiesterase gamma-1-like [Argiope bruennichi]